MTTFKPNITRFVRRGSLLKRPITGWKADMLLSWDMMWAADWHNATTPLDATQLTPPITKTQYEFDYGQDHYDAVRVSGNDQVDKATGKGQDIFDVHAGMVAYRLEVPDAAMETTIAKVSFRAVADKFALGGVKIAVFLSDNPTPPVDFERCRNGGTDDTIDATGAFATPEKDFTVDAAAWKAALKQGANIPARIGVLAAVQPTLLPNNPEAETFEFDTSSAGRAFKFVYVVLSMFTPDAWRDQYYIEGSAMIQHEMLELTTVGTLDEVPESGDFATRYNWRVALNMAQDAPTGTGANAVAKTIPSMYHKYKYPSVNVVDKWMGLDWGVKQALLEGRGNLFTMPDSDEITTGDEDANAHVKTILIRNRPALAPCAWVDADGFVQVRKSMATFACPRDIPDGATLWMRRSDENFIGLRTTLRVLVYSSTSSTNNQALWTGKAPNLMAMQDFPGGQVAGWMGIRLRAFDATQSLVVLAALVNVAREDVHNGAADAPEINAGFVARVGFDLRDAHIAMRLTPSVTDDGWTPNIPVAIRDGLTPPTPPELVFVGFRRDSASNPVIAGNAITITNNLISTVTFFASLSGGVPPMSPKTGGAFWSLAGTGATITAQDGAQCAVRLDYTVAATLTYSAKDSAGHEVTEVLNVNATLPAFGLDGFRQGSETAAIVPGNAASVAVNPGDEVTFFAAVHGGNGSLSPLDGNDYWSLAGTGAAIVAQTSKSCTVKFNATGAVSLEYKARDTSGIGANQVEGSLQISATTIPRLEFSGFRKDSASGDIIGQADVYATPATEVMFFATATGGNGELRPAKGSSYWSVSGAGATITANTETYCIVRFAASGTATLTYSAKDTSGLKSNVVTRNLPINASIVPRLEFGAFTADKGTVSGFYDITISGNILAEQITINLTASVTGGNGELQPLEGKTGYWEVDDVGDHGYIKLLDGSTLDKCTIQVGTPDVFSVYYSVRDTSGFAENAITRRRFQIDTRNANYAPLFRSFSASGFTPNDNIPNGGRAVISVKESTLLSANGFPISVAVRVQKGDYGPGTLTGSFFGMSIPGSISATQNVATNTQSMMSTWLKVVNLFGVKTFDLRIDYSAKDPNNNTFPAIYASMTLTVNVT